MINEINTELFVELSDEQQQLVAGGNGGSLQFDDLIKNTFAEKTNVVDSKVYQTADGYGSSTLQETTIANREVASEALKKFGITV